LPWFAKAEQAFAEVSKGREALCEGSPSWVLRAKPLKKCDEDKINI